MSCFVILTFKTSVACNLLTSTLRKNRDCRNFASKALHVVKVDEVRRFMEDSLKAVGAPESEAKAHADLLIYADTMGHYTYGLHRLVVYLNDCKSGVCVPTATPEILKESVATAWVDGHHALGATVGNFCMKIAIEKAKECGVGWVSVKRSNHYGMAGYWALQAEREGLIGVSFSNSSPITSRSKERVLDSISNPIAIAAPAGYGDKIMVDMAPTTLPLRKISKAGEPKPSSYEGYNLASIVETFCSGLSGTKMSYINYDSDLEREECSRNIGQCFAAINPHCFSSGFLERIGDYLYTWRELEQMDPSLSVIAAAGDKQHKMGEGSEETVTYSQKKIEAMNTLAKTLRIKPIKLLEEEEDTCF